MLEIFFEVQHMKSTKKMKSHGGGPRRFPDYALEN